MVGAVAWLAIVYRRWNQGCHTFAHIPGSSLGESYWKFGFHRSGLNDWITQILVLFDLFLVPRYENVKDWALFLHVFITRFNTNSIGSFGNIRARLESLWTLTSERLYFLLLEERNSSSLATNEKACPRWPYPSHINRRRSFLAKLRFVLICDLFLSFCFAHATSSIPNLIEKWLKAFGAILV